MFETTVGGARKILSDELHSATYPFSSMYVLVIIVGPVAQSV